MVGKCSNPDCVAPISCHEGRDDYAKCEFWLLNNSQKPEIKEKQQKESDRSNLNWTGEPFKIEDVAQISRRTSPIFIGLVGRTDAGKTTFLAMLYTLLFNGRKIKGYNFAGTKTILGWDYLYSKLILQKNKVSFPEPTLPTYHRLLHLSLRNKNNTLKDVLISEASGESFGYWSHNREDENAGNARWIYEYSNAFILFIDCEDMINRKNLAKTEIIDLAQMLQYDLKERPVISVWSKSDKKKEINSKIRESLSKELQNLFKNYSEIDISNFSSDMPDKLVHENNLKVIDWLLNKILMPTGQPLFLENNKIEDFFLNYKGR